jgi:hypothetical protein
MLLLLPPSFLLVFLQALCHAFVVVLMALLPFGLKRARRR